MTQTAATMKRPSLDIKAAIALTEMGADRFSAAPTGGPLVRPFGGHVLAITLAAAQRTVPAGRPVASCHSYFTSSASVEQPFTLTVKRDSDGRSFSHRRVALEQEGKLILSLSALFHQPEDGPQQQTVMPDVPSAEMLRPQDDIIAEALPGMPPHRSVFWDRDIGVDFRSVEPFHTFDSACRPAVQTLWLRIKQPLSDDLAEHQLMLTYASDFYFMHTGLKPLGISWCDPKLMDISLDHAIWFHQPFRADDWLLFVMESPFSGGARTLARGSVFTRDGHLVASVTQEGLVRVID